MNPGHLTLHSVFHFLLYYFPAYAIPPERLRRDYGTCVLEFFLSLCGIAVPLAQEISHPSNSVSSVVPDFLEFRMLPQLRLITVPLPCALGLGSHTRK